MPYRHRQHVIQLCLIVFCCLFVAVTRSEVVVESCPPAFLAPPPKLSWYQYESVAVRIDDAWSPEDRGYIREGIEKWNTAINCSNVNILRFLRNSLHDLYRNTSGLDGLVAEKVSARGYLYLCRTARPPAPNRSHRSNFA